MSWDSPLDHSSTPLPGASARYVLVADAQPDRTAACLESVKPFSVDVRLARDGDEALDILRRHGAPVLLITDLSLARTDGFAVIEALRAAHRGRAAVIAWSSSPELREFAAQRLAGLNVKVLGGAVAPEVLRGAIERAMRREMEGDEPPVSAEGPAGEDVYEFMTRLSEQARKLSGAAGVAVYWKAEGETRFRASVTWASETPVPHSPYHLPRVFGWILETGQAFVMPDLTASQVADVSMPSAQDVVRGLVAVPIVGPKQEIVGAICVFDLKPLTIGDDVVEALKALGLRARRREAIDRSIAGPGPEPARLVPGAAEAPPPRPTRDVVDRPQAEAFAGLLDRPDASLVISRELARLRREQRSISVVAFDVSPMGSPSEADAGSTNEVIGAVGEALARATRASDLAVRWSGADLLLVLPGVAVLEARHVAERVRAAMQAGGRYLLAVSGGVAELEQDESFEMLVARAKEKAQLARQRGHNRVA